MNLKFNQDTFKKQIQGNGEYTSLNRTLPSRSTSQHADDADNEEDRRNRSAGDVDDCDRAGRDFRRDLGEDFTQVI